MRRKPTLDYLWHVYLFHCAGEPDECAWTLQSAIDGSITCRIAKGPAAGDYCTFSIPKPKRLICVGIRENGYRREVFRPYDPNAYGNIYDYVVGPFKTLRGAEFMAKYGRNNPHCQTVDDAERLSKMEAKID